jgi:aminopeptidase N
MDRFSFSRTGRRAEATACRPGCGRRARDLSATSRPYFGAGWSTADITVSTVADQTNRTRTKGQRLVRNGPYRHFVSDAPILTFFSIQSARYAEARRRHAGVNLSVYYDPAHSWNVNRMLDALEHSLDYYQANFGPYQFNQARIIEFPGYETFAQAFANTMPYSEAIGFAADNSDPDSIDYVS